MKIEIEVAEGGRKCGGCTACCKILPVKEFGKPANTRCQHQRTGKGCAIFERRPLSCRFWNCEWLNGAETRRPDRAHYVIDVLPDYVTLQYEGAEDQHLPVIQVWLDPAYPDAHKDKDLRAYIERRGLMAICRLGSKEAFVLCPPALAQDGQWHEQRTAGMRSTEHSLADVARVLEGRK